MTNEKKMTKVQKFEIIANIEEVKNDPMLAELIAGEIERLKNSSANRKPTATQKANEELAEKILAYMAEHGEEEKYTVSDLLKKVEACAGLSNQKVSAMMRILESAQKVEKVIEKRKSYFKLA